MITDKAIFSYLESRCHRIDESTSSHWQTLLAGFNFANGVFESTGLPEGGGIRRRSFLRGVIHGILQIPYMVMGLRYRDFPHLLKAAKVIHRTRGTSIDLGTLRQVLTLSILEKKIAVSRLDNPVVVIGDGYGVFSSLLITSRGKRDGKIVLVNLTQNLLVDAVYLKKSFPEARMCLVDSEADYIDALNNALIDMILIQADNYTLIGAGPIGLAVNIASMQEMELDVIRGYFSSLRQSTNGATYLYCCNRDEKLLPDGSIIRFDDYSWHADDQILLDEICPWQKYYYDQHFPFYHFYDGSIRHRLALLSKS